MKGLKKYETSIKKKHSFAFTPKFKSEFNTDLNQKSFVALAAKSIEKLDWDIVFQDDTTIEAKRRDDEGKWTEKIVISYDYGKANIKSSSLGNETWDKGKNSLRVKLFIYVFQNLESEYDQEALNKLEQEFEKENNWDNYEIPESLPQPGTIRTPSLVLPSIVGIIVSFLLGFMLSFLSIKGIYIIGIFELGIAIAISSIFKYLIKIGNYTDYGKLRQLLIAMILIIYLSNQYFQYLLTLNEIHFGQSGFISFMKLKFETGLTIKSLNTGWIGLLLSWAFQFIFTYWLGSFRLRINIISYCIQRIPSEVIDFAFYHVVKEKTEDQLRSELSKMGWIEKRHQDEVFESIAAVQEANTFKRIG